ncbi:plasmid stabilization system protein ParE [Chryseobacterium sp. SORGH_AS909]|uniref:Plasmid stabilization system protein ParE n=1 Tax=Chryseobacterium camelliae TaxID=1265445 RepID=A0ABU0TLU3_9FLAO|nr:plasmid stabilization system protein ParE [Chryseobacterium camelliae]MDQ1101945.1 plasmid stabilization system protein ParE [Chryseobacterium sp. SORGH_AS_1048]MDR6085385.1 plasmid stabilization system protein ParE [Chryseobacterium sp. SORGH_AS_0909]MDR6129746.1 plasmid stabilization system protein ParE [Chryseobacterium sp. SORGH_AS_1175]MDT3408128.1 plasmid stabilization system protein ParE [Pseudacidovorax intermedius]
MDFDYKFLPTAERDIEEATDYYANISFKVLKSFNKQIDVSISNILRNPYFQKKVQTG